MNDIYNTRTKATLELSILHYEVLVRIYHEGPVPHMQMLDPVSELQPFRLNANATIAHATVSSIVQLNDKRWMKESSNMSYNIPSVS